MTLHRTGPVALVLSTAVLLFSCGQSEPQNGSQVSDASAPTTFTCQMFGLGFGLGYATSVDENHRNSCRFGTLAGAVGIGDVVRHEAPYAVRLYSAGLTLQIASGIYKFVCPGVADPRGVWGGGKAGAAAGWLGAKGGVFTSSKGICYVYGPQAVLDVDWSAAILTIRDYR